MVILLSLTGGTVARFLQVSNTTVIAPNPMATQPAAATNITYNSSLLCGECIVGNYVFCINGPENFTGAVPPQTVCCQNASSCPQAKNASWTCSNKYDNSSQVYKFRVCPYNATACGPQSVSMSDLGSTSCTRLNTLKKGAACLYVVQSQCAVPTLKLNDTSLFSVTTMISNTTIVSAPASTCWNSASQQCTCFGNGANSTNMTCSCQTVFNTLF